MFFSNPFLRVDLQINLLVLSEFGNQNVLVQNAHGLDLGVVLGDELYVLRIYVGVL